MMKRGFENKGFTLIETAIAVTIIGLMLSAMAAMYNISQKQTKERVTHERMQTIVRALSTYVETASRLPCPANPALNNQLFGWEWNVANNATLLNAGAAPQGECDSAANTVHGIVPFQTLNLPPETVVDGWGRYFTYAVSPAFTVDTDASAPNTKTGPGGAAGWIPSDANDQVHARCRDGAWLGQNDNINAAKARFCCAVVLNGVLGFTYPPNTDIVIRNLNGTTISPVRVAAPTGYNTLNTLNTGGKPTVNVNTSVIRASESTENITAPAFVLISHGENGRGAYLANGGAGQFQVAAGFTLESPNWTANTRIYNTGQHNFGNTPATYFDDIVVWMTQDGIMAANGTSSCQYP